MNPFPLTPPLLLKKKKGKAKEIDYLKHYTIFSHSLCLQFSLVHPYIYIYIITACFGMLVEC